MRPAQHLQDEQLPKPAGGFRYLISRLKFWFLYPFVIAAFKLRERKRFNRNYPVRWMSQARLMAADLEYYTPEEGQPAFDRELANDILKVRAEQSSGAEKFWLTSVAILAFLAANVMNIDLSISVFGVGFKKFKGAAEILILISSALTFRSALFTGRMAVLTGYLRYYVENLTDPQFRAFYVIKYLPERFFGLYFPINLPHIHTPPRIMRFLTGAGFLALFLLITYYVLYITAVSYLLIEIGRVAALGYWTYVVLSIAAINYVFFFIYSIFTLGRLPRRDFINLHKVELLRQIDPEELARFNEQQYRDSTLDQLDLISRGYIKEEPRAAEAAPNQKAQLPADVAYPKGRGSVLDALMSSASFLRR